jgi:hypothetical protein
VLKSPTGRIHDHWVSAATAAANGTEPGLARPYDTYSSLKKPTDDKSPTVRQIQPTGLRGRLEEIRAPTRRKTKKGTLSTTTRRRVASLMVEEP